MFNIQMGLELVIKSKVPSFVYDYYKIVGIDTKYKTLISQI